MTMDEDRSKHLGGMRSALVDYFREKAAYRRNVAERLVQTDSQSVGKNESYAESIELVMAHVATLPDDDSALNALADCQRLYFDDAAGFQVPSPGDGTQSATDSEAIHCGPRGKVIESADVADWFASWARTAVEEANRMPFEIWCETCVGFRKFDAEHAGKQVPCPDCETMLTVQ
jgi:hypothetical protein